jgi:hypothetical protein
MLQTQRDAISIFVALVALALVGSGCAALASEPKTRMCWVAPVKGSAGLLVRNCRSFTSPTGAGPSAADPPNAPPQIVDPGDDDNPPREGPQPRTPPNDKPSQTDPIGHNGQKPFVREVPR